MIIDRFK